MIATVTLNPAVDKTMTGTALLQGQVNRMKSVRLFAGGKGVNVTKLLRRLGEEVTALGFLGGYTGAFILDDLKKRGVGCHFTQTAASTRTTLNILAEDGYVTEILEPGETVSRAELDDFLLGYRLFADKCGLLVLSGSLPQGAPVDFYAQLVRIAREKGCRVLLDTSGEALAEGVKAGPDLIKPNVRELEYLAGRPLREPREIAEAVQALRARTGIPAVIVSRGKRGLLTVWEKDAAETAAAPEKTAAVSCASASPAAAASGGRELLTVSVPDVPVVNTVGSGDCVVASLAWSMARDCAGASFSRAELARALRRAAALSSANVTTMESGDVPLETAERLMDEVVLAAEPWP